jgi:hypothetical protein
MNVQFVERELTVKEGRGCSRAPSRQSQAPFSLRSSHRIGACGRDMGADVAVLGHLAVLGRGGGKEKRS